MMRYETFLGAVLLLLFASARAQVAPGDEHDLCNLQVSSDPRINIMMDTKHYKNLLGTGGVWDQVDFDDNNPEITFNPTFWRHNAGGFCSWSVRSCGFSSGPQDNWLFTQFISKEVPPSTTHTIRAIIDISYTLTSCRTRYRCNPVFRLYRFETDGPQPREVYTDRSNYESVRNKTGASAITQTLTESIAVGPGVGGFYLAIRDLSSCIQLARMQITRYQCRVKQEGLVIFPETAAPMDDQMTVTSLCMPNSTPVSSMNMVCDKEGNWGGQGTCKCDAGYKRVPWNNEEDGEDDDDDAMCKACEEGTYRSRSDSEYICRECPANTERDEVAAIECECQPGYFRNTVVLETNCPSNGNRLEDISSGCSQPPGMPLNLRESGATDTSLGVSWNHPTYNGGRGDLYYQVDYSDPDNVGVMLEAQCEASCSSQTSCTITGLRPATQYVVRVSAHNGVSDQDQRGALARMTTVTLETDTAPPTAPRRARGFCQVVVWEKPEFENGAILNYHLQFEGLDTVTVAGDSCFYILPSSIRAGSTIQIAAVNLGGEGDHTTAIVPDDCGSDCTECPDCPECPDPTPSSCPSVPVPTITVTRAPSTSTRTSTRTVTTTAPPVTTTRVLPAVTSTRTVTSTRPPVTSTRTVTSIARSTVTSTTTRVTSTPCPTILPDDTTRIVTPETTAPPTTTSAPSLPDCAASDSTKPSDITGVIKVGCGHIEWEPATVNGCVDPGLTYKIRIFRGLSYGTTAGSQKVVLSSPTNALWFTSSQIPTSRPLQGYVKARRSNGKFSANWSAPITISESFDC